MKTPIKIIAAVSLLIFLLSLFLLTKAQAQVMTGGWAHSAAICTNGTVWAWGNNNSYGQLGDNLTVPVSIGTPVQVHGPANVGYLTSITNVSAGWGHTLALKNDSTVWAWGDNTYGQLGDNSTTQSNVPIQVHGAGNVGFLTGITAIAAGEIYSLALKKDSTVWAWGDNTYGQLGDNSTTTSNVPLQVHGPGNVGFLTGIIAIAGCETHTLALKSDGTVWAWGGSGWTGELGDNTTTPSSVPVQVHGPGNVGFLTGITAISAGGAGGVGWGNSIALKNDGTVWTWGYNFTGTLGDNSANGTVRTVPVQVHGTGDVGFLTGITAVKMGAAAASMALKSDSTVWTWGGNGQGRLGDNTTTARYTPVQVHGTGNVGYLTGIVSIMGGMTFGMALKKDSTVWMWGADLYGTLGDNAAFVNKYTPVQTALCKVMVPLPIELLSFTAKPIDNKYVLTEWITATEINNDYFAVQRSKDGITFTQIGTVKGAGNSSSALYYEFNDQFPYTGLSYYRLRQVDYNGEFTYSEIRPVYIGTLDLITIYPNPSTDGSIQYTVASETGGELSVNVYDIIGRKVISHTETLEGGVATKKLSTAALSSGSYLLQITNGDLEKTQKQFVVR